MNKSTFLNIYTSTFLLKNSVQNSTFMSLILNYFNLILQSP